MWHTVKGFFKIQENTNYKFLFIDVTWYSISQLCHIVDSGSIPKKTKLILKK